MDEVVVVWETSRLAAPTVDATPSVSAGAIGLGAGSSAVSVLAAVVVAIVVVVWLAVSSSVGFDSDVFFFFLRLAPGSSSFDAEVGSVTVLGVDFCSAPSSCVVDDAALPDTPLSEELA
jgi:hypothetical protein